jgi:hypothetical protein
MIVKNQACSSIKLGAALSINKDKLHSSKS